MGPKSSVHVRSIYLKHKSVRKESFFKIVSSIRVYSSYPDSDLGCFRIRQKVGVIHCKFRRNSVPPVIYQKKKKIIIIIIYYYIYFTLITGSTFYLTGYMTWTQNHIFDSSNITNIPQRLIKFTERENTVYSLLPRAYKKWIYPYINFWFTDFLIII